jgi:hypothetical protein
MKRSTYQLTHKVFEVPFLRPSDPEIDVSPCGETNSARTETRNPSVLVQETRPSEENDPQSISPNNPTVKAAEPTTRRPTDRCPICPSPYGRHFWRDSYGFWRCTQCHPPAAVAMVREQCLVSDGGPNGTGGEQLALIASSGEIVAGEAFPAYARGRWRYYEDRWGRHFERITYVP